VEIISHDREQNRYETNGSGFGYLSIYSYMNLSLVYCFRDLGIPLTKCVYIGANKLTKGILLHDADVYIRFHNQ
jgi:hypothetical protein